MIDKIKSKINIENLLIFYIAIQALIDATTSLCVRNIKANLSVGIFIRTFLMIVLVLYAFIKSDKKYKILMIIYYGIIGIYMIAFMAVCYSNFGMNSIIFQIKGVIKTFFFPIVLVALVPLFKDKKINIPNKTFSYALFGYTAIIFICKILGISYTSYPEYKSGTIGLFFAANEIGAILCVLSPFLIEELINKKIGLFSIISLGLFLYASSEVGTKVPFMNIVFLIILTILLSFVKLFNKDKRKRGVFNLGIIGVVSIILVFTIGKTSIGKNLESIYGISFPEISFSQNKTNDIKEDKNTEKKQEEKPKLRKFKSTDEAKTVITSSRTNYRKNNSNQFFSSKIQEKIFGIGYLTERNGEVGELKLAEMDCFDILYCQGFMGIILYFLPVLVLIAITIKNNFKKLLKIIFNEENIFLLYSLFIAVVVGFTAGHVFSAPAVSFIIAIVIMQLGNNIKKIKGE